MDGGNNLFHRSTGNEHLARHDSMRFPPMYRFPYDERVAMHSETVFLPVRESRQMSHEELLALQESVGYVKIGLSRDAIRSCVTFSDIHATSTCVKENLPLCVICQSNFEDLEVIGTTDCGHRYHELCIQKWLEVKNVCPICNSPAMKHENSWDFV